jgi:uncharacterized protein involved in cysteine biosynthesis
MMPDDEPTWLEILSRIAAWLAVFLFAAMVWLVLCRLTVCHAAPVPVMCHHDVAQEVFQ